MREREREKERERETERERERERERETGVFVASVAILQVVAGFPVQHLHPDEAAALALKARALCDCV